MEPLVFSNDQVIGFARWLKVICEPNRLMLLEQIIEGVQCNCELGDALQMAPNLISHHLGILRESGLVDVERDPKDARWVYYSINRKAMDEFKAVFGEFFNEERLQPRRLGCGPQALVDPRQNLYNLEK